MASDCADCKGACCRQVVIRIGKPSPDELAWLETRGEVVGESWRIRSECKYLAEDGRCSIYEDRPQVCRDFRLDSPECKRSQEAIRRL